MTQVRDELEMADMGQRVPFASVLIAPIAAAVCPTMPDETKSIAIMDAVNRPHINGEKKLKTYETFQSNPYENRLALINQGRVGRESILRGAGQMKVKIIRRARIVFMAAAILAIGGMALWLVAAGAWVPAGLGLGAASGLVVLDRRMTARATQEIHVLSKRTREVSRMIDAAGD